MVIRSSAITRPATVRASGWRTVARDSFVFSGSEKVRITCPGAVARVDPGSGVDDTNPACASAVAGRATTAIAANTIAASKRLLFTRVAIRFGRRAGEGGRRVGPTVQ